MRLTSLEFKAGARKIRYVPKQRDRPTTRRSLRASKNLLRLRRQHLKPKPIQFRQSREDGSDSESTIVLEISDDEQDFKLFKESDGKKAGDIEKLQHGPWMKDAEHELAILSKDGLVPERERKECDADS